MILTLLLSGIHYLWQHTRLRWFNNKRAMDFNCSTLRIRVGDKLYINFPNIILCTPIFQENIKIGKDSCWKQLQQFRWSSHWHQEDYLSSTVQSKYIWLWYCSDTGWSIDFPIITPRGYKKCNMFSAFLFINSYPRNWSRHRL